MVAKRKRDLNEEQVGKEEIQAATGVLKEEVKEKMQVEEGSDSDSDEVDAELEYEKERSMRLEENKKRMEELGLASILDSLNKKPKKRTYLKRESVATPPRRSARLEGSHSSPVYREPSVRFFKSAEDEYKRSNGGKLRRRSFSGTMRPEIYTEEHAKLLGSCRKDWELFRDGCYPTGGRIYDPEKGKTCHQCRQKTLGLRTWCSSCETRSGQFCGDCLFMRYGENVLEARENQAWVCPVCRGICNCSLCRIKRGWSPTGNLYRHALAEGFKSVAHFLIMTCREKPEGADENAGKIGLDQVEDTVKKSEQEGADHTTFQPYTPSPCRTIPRSASKFDTCDVIDVETGELLPGNLGRTMKKNLDEGLTEVQDLKPSLQKVKSSPLFLRRSLRNNRSQTCTYVKLELKHEKHADEDRNRSSQSSDHPHKKQREWEISAATIKETNQGPGLVSKRRKLMSPGDSPEFPVLLGYDPYPTRSKSIELLKSPAEVKKEATTIATSVCMLSDDSDEGEIQVVRELPGRTKKEISRHRLAMKEMALKDMKESPQSPPFFTSHDRVSSRLRSKPGMTSESPLSIL